jgi:NAD(P)-dependent dehydrogenase (short-subunit alcohol dehydrogenase family)
VTGGSRGIGLGIARLLAGRGARVALGYATDKARARVALAGLGGKGHAAIAADLADPRGAARLWAEADEWADGALAILVNNAGIYEEHPPLSTSAADWLEKWQRTLAANLTGPAILSHLAARSMAARGGGRIVNISSRGAFRGEPSAPAYGASKAGLNSLSQSLARALAPSSVFVFCIAPGWVATDMAAPHLEGPGGAEVLAQHPMGRVASAEEVARAAVFCALDAPESMTGAIIDVNGASYLRS